MNNSLALYDLIKETFLLLDDGDRRVLARFNLTVPRFYALVNIGEDPGISLSQLSVFMLCDKSNITRIVKGLEADGYVTRRPHETDGRVLRLFLTEEGQALCSEVQAAHRAYNVRRFSQLAEIEQANIFDGLNRLKEELRQELYATRPA